MEEELINKKDIRKKRNILTLSILSTIIILLGSAYAFFTYFKSADAFTLTSNSITATFTEGTNQISFTNAYPISDEFALENLSKLDYIDFTVSGNAINSKEAITYEIFLTEANGNTLDKNYIKTYVTDENGGKVTDPTKYVSLPQTTYGNEPTGKVVLKKTYKGEFTKSYRLYIWLDKDYEQNEVSQTFSCYVNIYAYNDLETNAEYTAQQLITKIKTNNLKTSEGTPLNYVTETNNFGTETDQTITYLSGCSKYYLDQGAEGCTVDNTIDFNYVWYSGRMWRITSINETTNTIKLITEQPQTAIAWHDTNVEFEGSYMKQFLNDEFYDTLYQPTNFIDTSIKWDVTTTTSSSTKLSNPTITSNVGLLNIYEYYQSYQKVGSSNKYDFGYLNIGQYWWLLNLYSASYVWRVNSNGYIGSAYNSSPTGTNVGRPSINLLSTVNFTGSGTESDPYRLVGDKAIGATNEDIKNRQIGEYVKLKSGANEQVFRIVSFENNSTKLIALDYADSGNTKKFATANSNGNGTIFGEENTLGSSSNQTWYYYLTDPNNNSSYINDLKTKYDTGATSMFTTGEYYLGINADNVTDSNTYYNYRTSICASTSDLSKNCLKSRSKTLEAGLLRYGEMFAAQHGIGYNTKTSTFNTKNMWLMTRINSSYVWRVIDAGSVSSGGPASAFASRPSINLSSGVKIVACDAELCDGTPSHPYVVGL